MLCSPSHCVTLRGGPAARGKTEDYRRLRSGLRYMRMNRTMTPLSTVLWHLHLVHAQVQVVEGYLRHTNPPGHTRQSEIAKGADGGGDLSHDGTHPTRRPNSHLSLASLFLAIRLPHTALLFQSLQYLPEVPGLVAPYAPRVILVVLN
jgi:hypothetical protein